MAGGLARCALTLGFEKMQKGSLQLDSSDDVDPLGESLGDIVDVFKLAR